MTPERYISLPFELVFFLVWGVSWSWLFIIITCQILPATMEYSDNTKTEDEDCSQNRIQKIIVRKNPSVPWLFLRGGHSSSVPACVAGGGATYGTERDYDWYWVKMAFWSFFSLGDFIVTFYGTV